MLVLCGGGALPCPILGSSSSPTSCTLLPPFLLQLEQNFLVFLAWWEESRCAPRRQQRRGARVWRHLKVIRVRVRLRSAPQTIAQSSSSSDSPEFAKLEKHGRSPVKVPGVASAPYDTCFLPSSLISQSGRDARHPRLDFRPCGGRGRGEEPWKTRGREASLRCSHGVHSPHVKELIMTSQGRHIQPCVPLLEGRRCDAARPGFSASGCASCPPGEHLTEPQGTPSRLLLRLE